VLLFAAPARAATPVDYAALGDSYSSGVGTFVYDLASGTCLRSPRGYPQLWVNGHAVSSFRFVACGGATTADVLNNQLGALNAGTDLVTITIGGNDAGFADTLTTCVFGSDTDCINKINSGRAFVVNTLPGRLDATYAAIRARAPSARVVVLGYPRLFETTSSCGVFGMSLTKRQALNAGADLLASVIAGRAAAAGFTFADARPRFAGHGVCASQPWINNFSIFAIVESFHPTSTGYASGYLPTLRAVTG
jgi:lysophospholipase L1-like esterase